MSFIANSKPFCEFLTSNGIDTQEYIAHVTGQRLRYIRVNAHRSNMKELEENWKQFGCTKMALPGFYALNSNVKLANLSEYQNGNVYGLDISSGYAVHVLDPRPGDSVLDLCTAPGSKYMMIADRMNRTGNLVGVDLSMDRLKVCRSLLYKYQVMKQDVDRKWRCRLLVSDGTTFSGSVDSTYCVVDTDELKREDPLSLVQYRNNKSARKRRKLMHAARSQSSSSKTELYDKILVDAECTHDASISHVVKLETQQAVDEFALTYLNRKVVQSIVDVQDKLLANAFSLLKANGVLVYCTCSMSQLQNEGVVQRFLDNQPNAKLVMISNETPAMYEQSVNLPGTIIFTSKFKTSGFYMAKIQKDIKPL